MNEPATSKTEIPRLNVVSHIPLSSEMRSHIYQKLSELDQRLPQGSSLSLTLTKVKYEPSRYGMPAELPPPAVLDVKLTELPGQKKLKKTGRTKDLLKPKVKRMKNGVEAQVEIFSPNGQMTARGFGTDLFESVSGSIASLIEEIEFLKASMQGDTARKALIKMARHPKYLH